MISLQAFLKGVQQNAARVKKYLTGGDGSGGGQCDCIGLIIGAVRLAGGKWTGTHGSNYAARNEMRTLGRITEPFLGEVVYKAREPGEKGYDLPAKYKSSGDLKDYYHVGVVTSVDPLRITHCTSVAGGIKVDTSLGQWEYGGELKKVDYGRDEHMDGLYRAVVTADNQYPVKLRNQPDTKGKVVASIPQGTVVQVLNETDDAWARVNADGITGYMMRKFLTRAAYDPGGEVVVSVEQLLEFQALLQAMEHTVSGLLDE